ncbi:MAG: hypothetical protein ACI9G1_000119 [Pirellulaceae bacterium]|jgi:hypothetical protein
MLHHSKNIWLIVLLSLTLTLGCGKPETEGEGTPANSEHAHSHGDGDELVWAVKQKLADSEFEIWLGHHGSHFHAGDTIEPAISVTSSGEAYADAKVFIALVDPDNSEKLLGDEVPTVYEPATDEEIAHYAQGELTIHSDALKFAIRYRTVIADRADHIVYVPMAIH